MPTWKHAAAAGGARDIAHRDQVQGKQQRRVGADVRDGRQRALALEQQAGADHAQQHDAERRRQDVSVAGVRIQRLGSMEEIDQHQQREVEDRAAQGIVDGDIRRIGDGDRTDAGRDLGQRSRSG